MSSILPEFLEKCKKELQVRNYKHVNRPSNEKVAVIVEPRQHKHIQNVVYNTMFFLGNTWNLHIWTSKANEDWVRSLFPGWEFKVSLLPFDNITTTIYNDMFKDLLFWHSIQEEYILIFQTDCVMFKHGVDNWLDYDYVGANYFSKHDIAPIIGGVQGGFSLRKKSCMMDCILNVPEIMIQNYRRAYGFPLIHYIKEDVFFTHACEMLKKQIPPMNIRSKFSIEAEYDANTLAHHGFQWSYFSDEQYKILVDSSTFTSLLANLPTS